MHSTHTYLFTEPAGGVDQSEPSLPSFTEVNVSDIPPELYGIRGKQNAHESSTKIEDAPLNSSPRWLNTINDLFSTTTEYFFPSQPTTSEPGERLFYLCMHWSKIPKFMTFLSPGYFRQQKHFCSTKSIFNREGK